MEVPTIKTNVRTRLGKGGSRADRRNKTIPLVLYGGGKAPVSLRMDELAFEKLIHGRRGEHAVVKLEVEEQPELNSAALIKAVQHHPLRNQVLHADFQRIELSERIVTVVPIRLTGNARGVVEGGLVDHQLRDVEVECLATEVPDELVLDITEVGLGQSLHVDAIKAPEGVRIVTELDRTVVNVLVPRGLKTEEEEAAEAEAEGEGEETAAEAE